MCTHVLEYYVGVQKHPVQYTSTVLEILLYSTVRTVQYIRIVCPAALNRTKHVMTYNVSASFSRGIRYARRACCSLHEVPYSILSSPITVKGP